MRERELSGHGGPGRAPEHISISSPDRSGPIQLLVQPNTGSQEVLAREQL